MKRALTIILCLASVLMCDRHDILDEFKKTGRTEGVRELIFSDDFDRVNGTLGGGWINETYTLAGIEILSLRVRGGQNSAGSAVNNRGIACRNLEDYTPDKTYEATFDYSLETADCYVHQFFVTMFGDKSDYFSSRKGVTLQLGSGSGANPWSAIRAYNGSIQVEERPFTYAASEYSIRVQWNPGGMKYKIWEKTTTEPMQWDKEMLFTPAIDGNYFSFFHTTSTTATACVGGSAYSYINNLKMYLVK